MIYLITYDINSILKNHKPLHEAIKRCSIKWWHHMNNTWLIRSDLNSDQIFDSICGNFNQNDRVLIIQIHRNSQHQGWLNKNAWEWIERELQNA